ncbi:Eukaryotic peptide chain release factor GTP-binding subunit [Phytophthora cinnamomi]|uniref:Eukaryotic peptide chain release factor GTP-binding subunit n=1 Tax=Phytophthora cinnamomi TaxID=4785 RepID=UPI00355A7D2E|nr:Eukaryotic peptide chain release factor GTP-binding subunit [Phytophthora cinnamomi]
MGKWMTIDNKRELIRKHAATPATTQAQLAKLAKKEFRLLDPPARNTISDILRNAGTIMKEAYGQGKRRKPLKVKAPALERRLEGWIEKAEQRGMSFAIVQDMEKRRACA